MEIIFQKYVHSGVMATGDGQLLAESNSVSTDCDAVGRLTVDYYNYRINEAWWEIGRSPGGELNGVGQAPELAGVEAYLGAGAALRKALGGKSGGMPLMLMSECVKAILQAESFMRVDRGYPTVRSYELYWEEMYVNSCRYYSNLDRVNRNWMAADVFGKRDKSLFNRFVDCRVCRLDEGKFSVSGGFCDSVHELSAYLELDANGVITTIVGNYLRAPDPVCRENKEHLVHVLGEKPAQLTKKQIGASLGGGPGCSHLVDLVYEMCETATIALERNV